MGNINIFELKKTDLRNAVVIDGFPSVGLVSSIVASYLIALLKMEYIAVMDSDMFPTVSLIKNSEPLGPARIYARPHLKEGEQQIVVFSTELQPSGALLRPLGTAMIDFAIEQKCRLVISAGGLIVERGEEEPEASSGEVAVYGIGSTEAAQELLKSADAEPFIEGVISGTAGVLLNEGTRRGVDVITLLAEARPDVADARAAALILAVIDQMVLHLNLNVEPLCKEAERLEAQLKILHRDAEKKSDGQRPDLAGYH
ncbi:MAG: proteasome assembly chaperone family protein [Thermoplasmata archaeon]|nr:proteasome assembly chaperone family protein [Thermoplasmata archaeon]TFG69880.1 MAG: proteasome assembly chaperone family protein [Methanomassiliicoccus sp.]